MTATARRPGPRPRSIGRPSRLTRVLIDAICELIRETGVRPYVAAGSLGIPQQTYYRWEHEGRGEDAKPLNRELVLGVDEAFTAWQIAAVRQVTSHAKSDPRSAQFLIERRIPDDWGRSTKVNVSGEVTHRPMIDPSKYTVEEMLQLRALLAKGSPDASELPRDGVPAGELLAGIVEGELVGEEDVA